MSILWGFFLFNIGYIARLLFAFLVLMAGYNKIGKNTLLGKLFHSKLFLVVAVVFIIFDVLYNYIMSLWMWDPPDFWYETVSQRLGRYLETEPDSWRGSVAKFFCRIMNIVDPGHCHKKFKIL